MHQSIQCACINLYYWYFIMQKCCHCLHAHISCLLYSKILADNFNNISHIDQSYSQLYAIAKQNCVGVSSDLILSKEGKNNHLVETISPTLRPKVAYNHLNPPYLTLEYLYTLNYQNNMRNVIIIRFHINPKNIKENTNFKTHL